MSSVPAFIGPRTAGAFVGIACLLVLSGCKKSPPAPRSGPVVVNVITAVEQVVPEWDEFTGRIEAVEFVEIRPRVTGYLTEIHFKAGDLVEKGALLFTVDPRPYQADFDRTAATLDQAEAQLKLANVEFKRAQELRGKGVLAAEEFDQKTAALQQAQATVRAAKAAKETAALDLGFTQIKSPIAGRVSDARVTVGNLVSAAATGPDNVLTTVVSIDPLYVHVDADEHAVLRFMKQHAEGARKSAREERIPAYIQLANEKGFPHEGYLDFVDNRLDPTTGTLRARGVFKTWDQLLAPGFFVRMRIPSGPPVPAVLLPDEVISSQQGVKFVYIVKSDNTVERRNIETGDLHEGLRIVRDGLKSGERVVATRLQMMRPGLAVEPRDVEAAKEVAPAPPADVK